MRRTPVIVLAFLCLSGAAAAADDLAPIMQLPQMLDDLKGAKADSAAAVAATQAAEADAAPLLKEHKLWEDQLTNVLKPKYDAYNNIDIPPYVSEAARHDSAAARHNAACPAVVASQAQLARCNGEAQQLNAWKDRLDRHKEQLDREGAALDKQRDSILQRSREIEESFKPIKQRYDDALAKQQEATERIDALTSRIEAAYKYCKDLLARPTQEDPRHDVGEALHLCASVPFDNANADLPPLTDIKPPFSVTPNP